jgi:hypothetical protein
MKLRDEFAVKVLPSIIKIMNDYGKKNKVVVKELQVAKTAYSYADAMMEARSI